MNLYELIEQVTDQQSFYTFVEALIKDWGQNRDEWENWDIGGFLESALAWSQDNKSSSIPEWGVFAEFLFAGKYYE